MEKKELLISELDQVAGGLTCNHDLEWAGQCGCKSDDGQYYQRNAWNCNR